MSNNTISYFKKEERTPDGGIATDCMAWLNEQGAVRNRIRFATVQIITAPTGTVIGASRIISLPLPAATSIRDMDGMIGWRMTTKEIYENAVIEARAFMTKYDEAS
jgi:hypothetical protein